MEGRQSLCIFDDKIEIKILGISGDRVQLGISAPKSVNVVRSELKETMDENKNSSITVSKEKLTDFIKAQK